MADDTVYSVVDGVDTTTGSASSSFYEKNTVYDQIPYDTAVLEALVAQGQGTATTVAASAAAAAASAVNAHTSELNAASSLSSLTSSFTSYLGTANPRINGTASPGVSTTKFAREDHVHPTDSALAATLLGNTFNSSPLVNGVAAAGVSTLFARGDHVHPTDTSRASLLSNTFLGSQSVTGNVTLTGSLYIGGAAPIVLVYTGQSNDVNNAGATAIAPNLKVWDYSGTPPNVGTQFVSPSPSFVTRPLADANRIAWANPGVPVYAIPVACSGQPITQWMSGASAPDMFAEVVNNVQAALAVLGLSRITRFSWGQGEQDVGTAPTTYVANWTTVINRFYAKSWFPNDTRINIYGTINSANSGNPFYDRLNDTLAYIASLDPARRVFTPTGTLPASLWDPASVPHMLGPGYIEAGELSAALYLKGAGNDPRGLMSDRETGNIGIGGLPGSARLSISKNSNIDPIADGSNFHTIGADGTTSQVIHYSYGTGTYVWDQSYAACGTKAAPTAFQGGTPLRVISAHGFGTSQYGSFGAQITFSATENFTNTANGTNITFSVVPAGTVTPVARLGLADGVTVPSSYSAAFAVGPNGATNPALSVDGSTASAATGWKVTGKASGTAPTLNVTSPNANENGAVDAKGTGSVVIGANSTGNVKLSRDTDVTGKVTASAAFASTATSGAAHVDASGAAPITVTAGSNAVIADFLYGKIAVFEEASIGQGVEALLSGGNVTLGIQTSAGTYISGTTPGSAISIGYNSGTGKYHIYNGNAVSRSFKCVNLKA